MILVCLICLVSIGSAQQVEGLALQRVAEIAAQSCVADSSQLCFASVTSAKAILENSGGETLMASLQLLQVYTAYKEWRLWCDVLKNQKAVFAKDLQDLYNKTLLAANAIAADPTNAKRGLPLVEQLLIATLELQKKVQTKLEDVSAQESHTNKGIWGSFFTMLACGAGFVVTAITQGGTTPLLWWLCGLAQPIVIAFFGMKLGLLQEFLAHASHLTAELSVISSYLKILSSSYAPVYAAPIAQQMVQVLENYRTTLT
jgi:hypothetical protein